MAISLGLGASSRLLPVSFVNYSQSSSPAGLVRVCIRVSGPVTKIYAVSKQATETGKPEPKGIMKPSRVSPEMQDFLGGVAEIPRTQALKEIWAYIKLYDLQDPADKKVIICDDKLKTIFGGKARVGFLEIAGLISPHFLK